ncbi:MAG: hypothetical protein LPK09_11135 [Hymenobacteraceae bacterium]|nr:hypothetical protein [Hymenobacteraceae bacterium]
MMPIVSTFGQEAQKYFDQINKIVSREALMGDLYNRIDSLQSRKIPSRSGIAKHLDRDIDFGYRHQQISLQINFERFTIDLLTKNDSVLLSVISHNDHKKLHKAYYNELVIQSYLTLRNQFYRTDKKVKDLVKEISLDKVFAFYCGDGLPETDEGKNVNRLVKDKNIQKLSDMLGSINIETQSYGVEGFEMLKKKLVRIPKEHKEIIEHIKERNSEVITCSGCLSGLVNKLY